MLTLPVFRSSTTRSASGLCKNFRICLHWGHYKPNTFPF